MAKPKQVVVNDLMSELNSFGGHITEIQKAIESKGVTSEGKLFKFAEEIRQIEGVTSYREIISAIERAYKKGYKESDITSMLEDLADKNPKPKPDIPVPSGDFNADTATEILPRQFYDKSDLEGELSCPNVTKVGAEAFVGTDYKVVKLPKATEIDKEAFIYSNIKVLYIPSFVWKEGNLDLGNNNYPKYMLNKIIVADESVPPSDIGIYKVDFEVYNHDETKKWDIYSNMWKNV